MEGQQQEHDILCYQWHNMKKKEHPDAIEAMKERISMKIQWLTRLPRRIIHLIASVCAGSGTNV